MRDAFASEITALAAADERIVLVVGDIGMHLWDEFRARFPARFYNAGIAEQNMISLAAGLALAGLRPVVYTIASFAVTRCLEQIRVDLCYHNLPVVVVGVGAGLSYAALGPTHHACEDLAMLRCLPNLTIVCPCDPLETRLALRAALKEAGPVYLRLGKRGEPCLADPFVSRDFEIGKPNLLRIGIGKVCFLAVGPIAALAVTVTENLWKRSITSTVLHCHTVKPLHEETLREAFECYPLVVTLEEHSLLGGFGSAVAEWLADHPHPARLLRFGTPDAFPGCVGNREQALAACGLTAEKIAERILEALP